MHNFPEWYDFHKGVTGNGALLSLPDIRGEKENYYICLAYAAEEKEKADSKPVSPSPLPQPEGFDF